MAQACTALNPASCQNTHPSLPFRVQDLLSINSAVASSVLQVGTFVRLPPWASTCPDPDSDAASCRVYAGAWTASDGCGWL